MLGAGRWVDLGGSSPRPGWSPRLLGFVLLFSLATGLLGGRLVQLQVGQGSRLAAAGDGNRVHREVLEAERGIIYDRHGTQLAINRPAWSLLVVPAELPLDAGRRQAELERLAQLAGRSGADLRALLARAPDAQAPVTVRDDLEPAAAQALAERLPGLPGVRLVGHPVRNYVDGRLFSHVIGYTGRIDPDEYGRLRGAGYRPDQLLGKSGVEAGLEADLRGRDGWADVEYDAQGEAARTLRRQAPLAGDSVYLSIDSGLQQRVAGLLQEGIGRAGRQAGAALVVDTRDGELLAMASAPGFDANALSRGIGGADYARLLQDPAKPLYDRAAAGLYPPGSTFKMITAAAALEEGRIGAGSTLPCPAAISYGGWTYRNWAGYDMGAMNVRKALAVSCDTFFYVAAEQVGDRPLARYARAFGYGRAPHLEIPRPAAGIVPDRDWLAATCGAGPECRWNPGETLTMGIGQSYLLTTPLIQAMYTSALANGGTLLSPTLVSQVRDPAGAPVRNAAPAPAGRLPVSPDNLATVRQGMHDCMNAAYGTGFRFRAAGFSHDGGCKTGTAQYGGSGTALPEHAWFLMFTPFDNPEVAIVVLVEGGGEGSDTAEPIAVGIADYYYSHRDAIRAPGPA